VRTLWVRSRDAIGVSSPHAVRCTHAPPLMGPHTTTTCHTNQVSHTCDHVAVIEPVCPISRHFETTHNRIFFDVSMNFLAFNKKFWTTCGFEVT
jgi:hypothetical protein